MANVNPNQLQKYLTGMSYPASKDALIKHAEGEGADDRVLDALRALADDQFETPADVSKGLGQED